MIKHSKEQVKKLFKLLSYSDKYMISIQFWPELTAVYISKDDVDISDYGGDFDFAIDSAIAFLERINKKNHP